MDEPRKRGRPRIHKDRQQAWKDRTGFEQTEKRKQYRAEWMRKKRQQQKEEGM